MIDEDIVIDSPSIGTVVSTVIEEVTVTNLLSSVLVNKLV